MRGFKTPRVTGFAAPTDRRQCTICAVEQFARLHPVSAATTAVKRRDKALRRI